MRLGVAHSAGKYTYPSGSGTQFMDGVNAIFDDGYPVLKIYCTADYLTNYPLETSWSSTPTTLTELAQTTEFATALGKAWNTVVMTCFTFANGSTNWWRVNPRNSKYAAEYTEMYNLAAHLLSTYNGTGRTFVLQNWEGDWAFMDSFTPDTWVDRNYVDRYGAFLGTRQRAVEAARRAIASDCKVLCAFECNRVLDSRLYPHRRRILRDLAKHFKPDVISWSSYDGSIVDQGGWGAGLAAWTAATTPAFTKGLRAIDAAFPGVPKYIGEIGFPEGPELPVGRDVGAMVQVVHDLAAAHGVEAFLYWQVFDNEDYTPGTVRGFYTIKPDGTHSSAGTKLISLL